jgi:hypothetical protein
VLEPASGVGDTKPAGLFDNSFFRKAAMQERRHDLQGVHLERLKSVAKSFPQNTLRGSTQSIPLAGLT